MDPLAEEPMQFDVLGPVRVSCGGRPVPLQGCRMRVLLVALIAHANAVVNTAELVDWLWPDDPPASALVSLRAHVSKLRASLDPDRCRWSRDDRLRTQPPGYVLRVGPDEVDTARFERMLTRAQHALRAGAAEPARTLLDQALRLWRGPALTDAAHVEAARGEIARLEELRLTARTLRVEVDLALGRHDDALPELRRLVADHPLHERFYALLMVALHRGGRRADALTVYRRAGVVLAEELSVTPGPVLRRAEAAIRADDTGP